MASTSYPPLGKVHSSSVELSRTMHTTSSTAESRPDMWTLQDKKWSVPRTPSNCAYFIVEWYRCTPKWVYLRKEQKERWVYECQFEPNADRRSAVMSVDVA